MPLLWQYAASWPTTFANRRIGTSPDAVQLWVEGSSGVRIVQLLQSDLPATNKTVPTWNGLLCTFQVTRLSNGRASCRCNGKLSQA